ncbi:unnamed protein product [Linum tenue]|uniref:Kinesin-like protein KIN-10A n=1 Tax=Linum tenue TaxID=586396 RepID=A0AAV0RML9_9ROSI|nr:unnamed protein product [Linum tenue]
MAPTPSSSSKLNPTHHSFKTPQSKQRLNFTPGRTPNHQPSPNPNPAVREVQPIDHPIEVIGRIRDFPDRKEKPVSVLTVNPDGETVRVRAEIGYRDFTLDGVSLSEQEDLDSFYKKFIESRITGVKLGEKCTIMMYGPTGSGKSHTMFGCPKQPGIVYKALKDILGEGGGEEKGNHEEKLGLMATFVHVTVLEIYNEEIYDLLSSNGGTGGFGMGWPKGGSASKARLEVMGKKAKNATFISGSEASKILKEIQKVEKKRIVKSTLCNERSSRSHCMIILDVPTVGGRLMLVDMAGSENIEQAGQTGFEAKMQTAKINQGNTALKRVVESIANGDSHVPFRDSKLTMLLQDSFEDDKSKILMILCASPDPKEIHKTICTLEYGAKAKCIVRGPHTPIKDTEDPSSVMLGSRIAAMDEFIYKLQLENKAKEKERKEANKQLMKKEEEIASLRAQIAVREAIVPSEEEINLKVNERTQMMKLELERKLQECQKAAEKCFEIEKKRMEEKILQQQQEVEMLRRRLEEIELEASRPKVSGLEQSVAATEVDGCRSSFASRLLGACGGDDEAGMVKSMDLDMGDQEVFVREVKFVNSASNQPSSNIGSPYFPPQSDAYGTNYGDKFSLTTVFEEEEVDEEDELQQAEEQQEMEEEEEVEKKVIEVEWRKPSSEGEDNSQLKEDMSEASRKLRIQNIFTLCGNHRELSQTQTINTPVAAAKGFQEVYPEKENNNPQLPLTPLLDNNKLPPLTPSSCLSSKQMTVQEDDGFSAEIGHLTSTPFITKRKALH